jgi:hypothetical protein
LSIDFVKETSSEAVKEVPMLETKRCHVSLTVRVAIVAVVASLIGGYAAQGELPGVVVHPAAVVSFDHLD